MVSASDAMGTPSTHPKRAGAIPQFVIGQEYGRRDDIHLNYGGSWQNGVSSSAVCPAIFLFTGDTGEQYGYKDGLDDAGVFSYSGEGQIADMQFKGGNKAVRDHAKDGRALYLFESLGKGKRHRYKGEFVLANYSVRRGPDRDHKERKIIVFHLLPVGAEQDSTPEVTVLATPATTLDEARKRAIVACTGPAGQAGKAALQTLYKRSTDIRDYVLQRAAGTCESCLATAPFARVNGSPYLEVHHTTRLSDGGLDHPMYTAAVCPNCHREIHVGVNGFTKNKSLQMKIEAHW